MIRTILITLFCYVFSFPALTQNVGVGTTSPQAKLDVHGTFKLQHGVTVNGISHDSLLMPGSDSLLVTQLAVKKYASASAHLPVLFETDSTFEGNHIMSMGPDSIWYATPDGWQSDSALNVFTSQGNVGMGVTNPVAKLAINGSQRIEGNHTLTLGYGLPNWQTNAAKIGYGMLTPHTLDIVGAGSAGQKKIKLWNDTWVRMLGKTTVGDSAIFQTATFQNNVWSHGKIGIGMMSGVDALSVKGKVRVAGGVFGGRTGIYGSMGYFPLRILKSHDCWSGHFGEPVLIFGDIQFGQISHVAEIGWYPNMAPRREGLNVRGSLFIADSMVMDSAVNVQKTVIMPNTQTIEMGAFIPGKEINAGKIGYQVFTPDALDIVGAGTTNSNRKINLVAVDKVLANGNLTINGALQTTSIHSEPWIELDSLLQNNWVNYGDGFSTIAVYKNPEGVVHMRGMIKDGLNQSNTLILTLPAGYRPASGHQIFEVINGQDTYGRIDVLTNGNVVFRGITNTFISLDQIAFKTN